MKKASNYPLKNAAADVYWAICRLGETAGCPVLKKVVSAEVYVRDHRHEITGIGGEKVRGYIVQVRTDEMRRVVALIRDNLKGTSPFRLSWEDYERLSDLVDCYEQIRESETLWCDLWDRVRHAVGAIRPDFYNAKILSWQK